MAAITALTSSIGNAATTGVTTRTCPLPTGWAVGDFAILVAATQGSATTFSTKPTGWTQLRDVTATNGRAYIAYRTLQAGDADPAVVIGTSGPLIIAIFAFRGVDTTSPFGTADATLATGSPVLSPNFPAVTPRGASDLLFRVGATRVATTSAVATMSAYGAGGTGGTVTEIMDICTNISGGQNCGVHAATQQLTAVTAIAQQAGTASSTVSLNAESICLRPLTVTVGGTRATSWDTYKVRAGARVASWDTLAATSGSRATSWATYAVATGSRATTWVTRALTGGSRSTSWDVLAAVAGSRVASWVTYATATGSRATSWATRAVASGGRVALWDTLTRVSGSRTTSWAVLAALGGSRATSWVTRALASGQRATSWVTRARTSGVRSALWDTLATVGGTRSTTWNILAAAPPGPAPAARTVVVPADQIAPSPVQPSRVLEVT